MNLIINRRGFPRYFTKQWSISIGSALALTLAAKADMLPVNLGSATDFAVLAGSAITITGAVSSTTITGDIGTFPTPAITGIGSVVLNGTNHGGDEVTQAAKLDLTSAYNDAVSRSADTVFVAAYDLLGLNLFPGVYSSPSSLFISGTLTLDGLGNPNAVWIFQMGSTLITAVDSKVVLTGGGQASHVFWQVGSSATLATGSDFSGSILALTTITAASEVTVNGRLLAQNGAVTLDGNHIITVPEPGIPLLVCVGSVRLCFYRRRESTREPLSA